MGYQKNVLVRLLDSESENVIKAYYTSNYSETLKMYKFMEEEEMPIKVPDDNDMSSKYANDILFIADIEVKFGSNTSIVCIDIYVGNQV